ncbi:MAG: response regulator [Candidatus Eremiobacterota bacterium]
MKKIIVIEDIESMRALIITLLQSNGFEVKGTGEGFKGIEMIKEYIPDLILCDVDLPDTDGYEILGTIRQDETLSIIPFIFLTVHANSNDIRHGMSIGADDYITKPFTEKELISAVKARLRKQEILSKHFLLMADASPVMIWLSGADKSCTYFNKRWLDFRGKTMEEEKHNGWLEGLYPEDVTPCMEAYRKAFNEKKDLAIEYRLKRFDNHYRWVLETGNPYFDSDGSFAGYIGSCIDITERKQMEEKLESSLREKEILLKEIHHRVKNNLQFISSLLYLQSANIENRQIRDICNDIKNRISMMANIHEHLYQSENFSCINFSKQINSLVNNIYQSYSSNSKKIDFNIKVEDIALELDMAISCSLILNELLTNSFKYAFTDKNKGEISIEFYRKGKKYILVYKDDGKGFPEGIDPFKTKSLGLHIVKLSVKQIDGNMEIYGTKGIKFKFEFSANDREQKNLIKSE